MDGSFSCSMYMIELWALLLFYYDRIYLFSRTPLKSAMTTTATTSRTTIIEAAASQRCGQRRSELRRSLERSRRSSRGRRRRLCRRTISHHQRPLRQRRPQQWLARFRRMTARCWRWVGRCSSSTKSAFRWLRRRQSGPHRSSDAAGSTSAAAEVARKKSGCGVRRQSSSAIRAQHHQPQRLVGTHSAVRTLFYTSRYAYLKIK